jgi:hypothetical protein
MRFCLHDEFAFPFAERVPEYWGTSAILDEPVFAHAQTCLQLLSPCELQKNTPILCWRNGSMRRDFLLVASISGTAARCLDARFTRAQTVWRK